MKEIIEIALVSALAISVGFVVVATLISAYELNFNTRRNTPLRTRFPVSILKPLKGLDDQLEANLRSFFTLDYPAYELIFGVAETDDPAIGVVKRLMRQYPAIRARLVIDTHVNGLNPKIANLRNMYQYAVYNHILISDSNVRVRPGYLDNMMSYLLKRRVGLVTSTIRGESARTFAGTLENLHLNSFVAASVFAVRRLFKIPVVIGKSMLLRRTTLTRIGGFGAFADFLAEDQLIGKAVRDLGLEVRASTHWINNINETWSWSRYLNRHIRWAKLRFNLSPLYYFIEILAHPLALSLLYLILRHDLEGVRVFTGVMAVKYACDIIVIRMLASDLKFRQYLLLPVKDAIMVVIWFIPFFDRQIVWRGNKFTISRKTLLRPLRPLTDRS